MTIRPTTNPAMCTLPAQELGLAVQEILDREPYIAATPGTNLRFQNPPSLTNVVEGRVSFPRFTGIIHLLQGEAPAEDVHVVEDGPGAIIHNAYILAALGFPVVLKESWHTGAELLYEQLSAFIPPEKQQRIEIRHTGEQLKKPSPAHILLCSHPRRTDIPRLQLKDVMHGGFALILENMNASPMLLHFDTACWEVIYSGPSSDYIMATGALHLPILHLIRRL